MVDDEVEDFFGGFGEEPGAVCVAHPFAAVFCFAFPEFAFEVVDEVGVFDDLVEL